MYHRHLTLCFLLLFTLLGSTACRSTSHSRLLATENAPHGKRLTFEQAYLPLQSSPRLIRELPEVEARLDDTHFLLNSDANEWSHLYHYDMEVNLKKRLTHGDWSVQSIKHIDEQECWKQSIREGEKYGRKTGDLGMCTLWA